MVSQSEIELVHQPIEITIAEPQNKRKSFVKETQDKDLSPLEKLKDEADYLSQFTKRVKEQLRAKNSGETKNRTGQVPTESDEARAKGIRGLGADPKMGQELQLPGPNPALKGSGSTQFGRQVVVGQSTMGEFIPGVKEGAFTALNSDRFTFYTFFARINDQVRSRWIRNLREFTQSMSNEQMAALAARERISEIDIQLDPRGQFVRAVILRSSGYRELDQAASEAFKDAAPFPNAPREMVDDDGLIHLQYGFIVHFQPSQFAGGR